MVDRTRAVLEEFSNRSHRARPLLLHHVPLLHLLGDLQVVQSPLVTLVDLISWLKLTGLAEGYSRLRKLTHEHVALGHAVVGFRVFGQNFQCALTVLLTEQWLLDFAVCDGAVGVIGGLLGVEIDGLGVAFDCFLKVAEFELVVTLVFAFFRLQSKRLVFHYLNY